MQAVKEKLNDMKAMRKAKAEAKEEEKAEKELAKARVEIAHEVRLAKEAEAAMELHVNKAADRADKEIAKHTEDPSLSTAHDPCNRNHGGHVNAATAMGMGYTTKPPPTNNLL